ncbi:hypothetical protein ColLi_03139 [Colletotrichum liriopes]|uniref:Integral membrane protein n=1 Tax=Colletotrichum liriopes TaxID=708192 RepID=A0AA37GH43_9PEZI|nr:hypothetical protein ColLi_03139 [Colletotrichum liriopes]
MSNRNHTLSPLPPVLRHGLKAVVTFSCLSLVTSFTLLIYLIGRLAVWYSRTSPKRSPSSTQTSNIAGLPRELGVQYHENGHASGKRRRVPNQFLILLLNVLLADTLQSCAFFLNIIWLVEDEIADSSPACWAQGWFISTGDLASAAFIATIAVHTYLTLCWINAEYEAMRLYLHYAWMLLLIITGTVSYVLVFIHVHREVKTFREAKKAAAAADEASSDGVLSPTSLPPIMTHMDQKTEVYKRILFLLYPLVFLLCTAPLALGRILSSGGVKLSPEYLIFAGAMITSNGWLDVLIFSTTRSGILFEAPVDEQNLGLDTFNFTPMGQQYGHRVWIQGGLPKDSQHHGKPCIFRKPSCRPKLGSEGSHDRSESQTSLHDRDVSGIKGIQMETVTRVLVEEADAPSGEKRHIRKLTSMPSEETVGERVQQSIDSYR